MLKKDFINVEDFEREELVALVELIRVSKQAQKNRALPNFLYKASIAMFFEEASTRTRTSFEVAATLLGGHALYMRPGDVHLGKSESLYDTAKVLSRMVDGVVIRSAKYETVKNLAEYADIPVINAMTDDFNHPTQVLCDIFTMFEKTGKIKGNNLVFIGDGKSGSAANVSHDLMRIAAILGINFCLVSPVKYQPDESFLNHIERIAKDSGATIKVTDDPIEGVKDADFIYTDEFVWYDMTPKEKEKREKIFKPKYQVNTKLLSYAPSHVKFMHCLPAKRGEEVTNEVMDGPHSIIFDQAENRLYTQIALLIAFIYPTLKEYGRLKESEYAEIIKSILKKL